MNAHDKTSDLVERRWTCFHCDETFTDEHCARLHFGDSEEERAACQIKAGAEGSILRALRDAERETRRAWGVVHEEISDVHKAYYAAQCRHTQSLQAAEELGYERGLEDARAEAAALIERQSQAAEALVEALKAANGILEDYIGFLHRMPTSDLELHPYIPSVEDAFGKGAAALATYQETINGNR